MRWSRSARPPEEIAGQRREAVDVLALPGLARVSEQVLDVDRPVRMADEVDGTPAVLADRILSWMRPPDGYDDDIAMVIYRLLKNRFTGIGGIFMSANDPKALGAWYKRALELTSWNRWACILGNGTSGIVVQSTAAARAASRRR